MTKITTADCRKFLATDSVTQELVKSRYDVSCADSNEPGEAEFYEAVCKSAQSPRNWRRRAKYKVGSKADMGDGAGEGGGYEFATNSYVHDRIGFNPEGGVVREFNLDPDTEIVVALLEKDGKLLVLDDLSD